MWKYFRAVLNYCSVGNPPSNSCLESNSLELLVDVLALPAESRVSSLLVLVGFLFPVTASQRVIDDKVSHFSAQLLSRGEVEEEMLAGEDAA